MWETGGAGVGQAVSPARASQNIPRSMNSARNTANCFKKKHLTGSGFFFKNPAVRPTVERPALLGGQGSRRNGSGGAGVRRVPHSTLIYLNDPTDRGTGQP